VGDFLVPELFKKIVDTYSKSSASNDSQSGGAHALEGPSTEKVYFFN